MHDFRYVGNKLFCEGVAVESLARKFGTPLYVYSQRTLTEHFQKLDAALAPLDHLVCFAMKSNSNLSVLRALANLGSGFDIVSGGELQRVIAAGGDPRRCVFAGVGKTEAEIEFALRQGIYSFNAESEPELQRINRVAARLKKIAPVAVRVNPDVDAAHARENHHRHLRKQIRHPVRADRRRLCPREQTEKPAAARPANAHRLANHRTRRRLNRRCAKSCRSLKRLQEKYALEFFSIGGGLGIVYQPALASGAAAWWKTAAAKNILTPAKYAARLVPLLQPLGLKILIEPGRFISGNAGILVTRVEYVKRTGRKNFVIVDAAMNDLIRPAFYDAYHEIVPLTRKNGAPISSDVVGPICESGDYFCKDRPLPKVGEGDYLALLSAGAYGFVMASNYNTRPLAAEILVNGRRAAVARERQPVKEIWSGEKVVAWLK